MTYEISKTDRSITGMVFCNIPGPIGWAFLLDNYYVGLEYTGLTAVYGDARHLVIAVFSPA